MTRYEEQVDAPRRRLHLMKERSQDTVTAYRWLGSNKHRFKGKIYGPIALNLNLKDQRYVNMVESILGGTNGAHLRVNTVGITLFLFTHAYLDFCVRTQGRLRRVYKGDSGYPEIAGHRGVARQNYVRVYSAHDA